MLILSRRVGEGFKIDDDVEITITKISGDRVKIAIKAPSSVVIKRSEEYEIDLDPALLQAMVRQEKGGENPEPVS